MGNVSLKVLETSLNLLFKKGYKPCKPMSLNIINPVKNLGHKHLTIF